LEVLVFVRDRLEARADGAGRGVKGVPRSTPVASFALFVAECAVVVKGQEAVVARRGAAVTRVVLGELRRLIVGVVQVELGGGQLLVV
jgi:hypothetical protein